MNNFKEGDKIRIKNEVSSETHFSMYPHFTEGMDELKDKVLTFSYINPNGDIKVENCAYSLHPDWVEPLNNFKEGDKIRIKDEVSSESHFRMHPHFMVAMDGLKDKVLTIRDITSRGYIKIEESGYNLHPEWVEKISEWTSAPEDDFESALTEIVRQFSEELGELEGLPELSEYYTPSILEEAQEILEGERDSDYGDPVANFNRISRIASSILDYTISPEECVVVMMAVKLSREQYKHKRDNLVDLVAYTEILNRVRELNK